uniref:Endoribonuclease YbeY n=1 Tax=Candidatus Kentrum sp. LPFa TaxID=2126335 RepID=A0A450VWI3_9GAMM|nr:MAG: rRNA maturation RNase YbeY [Candidatus Kentron sp. LPFa]
MKATVDVQYASTHNPLPRQEDIQAWVDATFAFIAELSDASNEDQRKNGYLGARKIKVPRKPAQALKPIPFQSGREALACSEAELTIRIVDEDEGIALNKKYRGQEMATNVLSFPCEIPTVLDLNLLGDIVICAPVVKKEIILQRNRPYNAHWAHMVVHGALHLLGYDHQSAIEARYMESMETAVLTHLGFSDPYRNSC